MYVPRTIEPFVKTVSEQFPVLIVTGARQVGKTTFLLKASEGKRDYVTLDDPGTRELAKRDPALFFQRFPPPVLIDEIQYAPELLPHIKIIADRSGRAGLFWLTGAQPFHLMKGVSESLAGRVGVLHLLGLSRDEQRNAGNECRPFLPTPDEIDRRVGTKPPISLKSLYRSIWRGSFPAVALEEKVDRDLFYSSYVQTYLQRDVRDLAKVGDEMAFLRFLRASAARTGQILNLAELARDTDVSFNTAKNWLSILKSSGVVTLLEPYHNNLIKRLVKSPKLYFLDTGLCAYLTEWSTPETLESGAMSGAILETWILTELLKGYWHNGREASFHFYRDKEGKEIDLVLSQDGILYPLEFKKTASPRIEDIRSFAVLDKLSVPVGPGGLVCLSERSIPLSATVRTIPIHGL